MVTSKLCLEHLKHGPKTYKKATLIESISGLYNLYNGCRPAIQVYMLKRVYLKIRGKVELNSRVINSHKRWKNAINCYSQDN